MTVQERLDHSVTYKRFNKKEWREGFEDECMTDYPFIGNKILQLNNYGKKNTHVAIFKSLLTDKVYHFFLFTERYEYSIRVTPTYMCASSCCRYVEPLEDWQRGRDLPDGKTTEETFNNILLAIIAHELVKFDNEATTVVTAVEQSKTKKVKIWEKLFIFQ